MIYLLCHLLKTEADQVVITVMEVYREEQSVRRVRARSQSNTDRLQMLRHEYTAGQAASVGTGSQQYHALNLLF